MSDGFDVRKDQRRNQYHFIQLEDGADGEDGKDGGNGRLFRSNTLQSTIFGLRDCLTGHC